MANLIPFIEAEKPSDDEVIRILDMLKPQSNKEIFVADKVSLVNPEGFPFLCLIVDRNPEKNSVGIKTNEIYEDMVLGGRGFGYMHSEQPDLPQWYLNYSSILTHRLFGTAYPPQNMLRNYPVPSPLKDSDVRISDVRDDMMPAFARNVINRRISKVIGARIELTYHTVEFSNSGHLGLKTDLRKYISSQEMADAALREIHWSVPYIVVT